jgi:hypothetical protein
LLKKTANYYDTNSSSLSSTFLHMLSTNCASLSARTAVSV